MATLQAKSAVAHRPDQSFPSGLLPRLAWDDFRAATMRLPFFVILFVIIWVVVNASRFIGAQLGSSVHPVTSSLLVIGQNSLDLFVFVVIAIYSGQLVWREREANIAPLCDTLPIPNWLPLVSKLLALMLMQAVLYVVVILCLIVVQASRGYYNFELDVYAKAFLGVHWIHACLLCILAMAVHVVVNHKYLGYLVLALFYVTSDRLNIEHHLLRYASHPGYTYSDMSGFGNFVKPIVYFNLYWASAAVLIVAVASLLWVRGSEVRTLARLREMRQRCTGGSLGIMLAAAVSFVGLGGFIFYNTNILNEFRTPAKEERYKVHYEKRFKRFEKMPHPRIASVDVTVDINPDDGSLRLAGSYLLINRTDKPITTVLVGSLPEVDILRFAIGSKERPLDRDPRTGWAVYELSHPMKPGGELQLEFELEYAPRGFTNRRADTRVVGNGSYFDMTVLPRIGYISGWEVRNAKDRRRYDLPHKQVYAKVDDLEARRNQMLSFDSDWIDFKATVSTAADQIAVTSGSLKRRWQDAGRNYFRYESDVPMPFFFAFVSANYEVRRDRWKNIDVEVYYHADHDYNIDMMINAAKSSLEYCSANFGPYPHKQLRIVEVPRTHVAARAFPTLVRFSEGAGFITKEHRKKSRELHYPFHTTAHEVAHQWWAHQVVGGNVQGASMLTETLCQYSALMVMKQELGSGAVQTVLRSERDRYLRGRSRAKKEVPIAFDEVQQWVHYNKGSLAMYALREYIGERAVNQALAGFVRDKAFQNPPYTTSTELVERFREVTPDDRRYLIEDLFETITLHDLRATSATYRRRDDGKFEVRLKVEARKFRGERSVSETEIPINDFVEIGVKDRIGKYRYLKMHRIDTNIKTFDIVVDHEPAEAGIDPRYLAIDRDIEDNVVSVSGFQPLLH